MGAGNVKLAYARWGDLADGPMRLLAYMAVIAMDGGEHPRFWGGRDALALATGRMVPDKRDDDPVATAERRRAFKAVDRMIRALKDAGAVTQVAPAAPGHSAVYALNLAARQTPVSGDRPKPERTPSRGDRPAKNAPRSEGRTDPGERANAPRLVGQTDPGDRGPEEYLGVLGTEEGGDGADLSTASHPPRATPQAPAPNVIDFASRKKPTRPAWSRSADVNQTLTAASERRRAAEAAHRAKEAT